MKMRLNNGQLKIDNYFFIGMNGQNALSFRYVVRNLLDHSAMIKQILPFSQNDKRIVNSE